MSSDRLKDAAQKMRAALTDYTGLHYEIFRRYYPLAAAEAQRSADSRAGLLGAIDALVVAAQEDAFTRAADLCEPDVEQGPVSVDTGRMWSRATASNCARAIRALKPRTGGETT